MRTRGGFERDLHWNDKRGTRVKGTSKAGNTFRMRSDSEMRMNGKSVVPKGGVIEFPTTIGGVYLLEKR